MNIISKLYNFREGEFKNLLKTIFKDDIWLKVFLSDGHHGFIHGNQVRLACLKLIKELNSKERKQLLQEGKKICKTNSHKYAVVAMSIAAIFHDCGRFNEGGQVIAKEQKYHHVLSAKRARIFCDRIGLNIIALNVEEAILSHDFQNQKLTPDLYPPKTIIGKIVQSSDQMGWFHPGSVHRTLEFNRVLGFPLYNPKVKMKERLKWTPTTKSGDALTVMLSQLFGPTDKKRFGIEFAKKKVEMYKIGLEKNIIKIAKKHNLKKEVESVIKEFKNRLKKY